MIILFLTMKHIDRPEGLTNSPLNILPYLPDEEGFFDSRHWVWGGLDEPMSTISTRISANNQQFLKIYEKEKGL